MSEFPPTPQSADAVDHVSDETLRKLIGYQMKRTFNVLQADLTETLEPFGLRMLTYTALILIVDNPGLRQSQLAEAMDIERPNMVIVVDSLERRNLITRNTADYDRRANSLKATFAGRKLCEMANEAVKAHEARMLLGLDENARNRLIEALQIIEKSFAKKLTG
jgi:DNA-binding MarR family transcriptional regulator